MRDLYEVLDVPEDADDSQLKKAYRKSALLWHPDKNQDRLEEADARFKEIQNAYEILSDKHERAWYDSHRDQILRAGSHQAGGGSGGASPEQAHAPEDTFLYQYFSSSCYSGFSDGPKGFYMVFAEVFAKLARAEAEAAERAAARGGKGGGEGGAPLPGLGGLQAPWAAVSAFYQAWLHFVSDREFAWADAHNLASAPNRKVRRLMEEDNKKRRRAARKEFQDTVRDLAAFVRKRDPRVAAWRAAEEAVKAERAAAEQRRREEEREARLQRAREYQAPAWAEPDVDAGGSDGGDASEDAAYDVADELYCVACDKLFRSANAMANHERSKKHLENAATLRAAMELEEEELSPDEAPEGGSADEAGGAARTSASEEEEEGPATDASNSKASAAAAAENGADKREERAQQNGHSGGDRGGRAFDERPGHDRGAPAAAAGPAEDNGDAPGAHSRSSSEEDPGSSDREEESDSEGSLDEDAMLARMLQAHARVRRPKGKGGSSAHARGDRGTPLHPAAEAEPPLPEPAEAVPTEQMTGPARDSAAVNELESHGAATGDESGSGPGLDEQMADPVHAKPELAAQQAAKATDEQDTGRRERKPKSKKDRRKALEAAAAEQGLLCTVCKVQFESRNQLFKHIAAKGHAQRK